MERVINPARYVRSHAERAERLTLDASRHLRDTPLPAIALLHRNRPEQVAEPLEHREAMERVATASGLFLVDVVAPAESGFEHVLFLSREAGLSDAELLACRRPRARNRHEAGDGSAR